MAEIIPFTRRTSFGENIGVIEKIVDGEVVECVDVDALSPAQRADFFRKGELAETRPASPGPLLSR
ncbi:hypothetical protein AB9E19_15280 [Rhizobium leguminosarum]|uniref:hypothetical protein n=1 Tax=Rhizobium leguminosarum TaxID=384 RepID=UPI003F9D15A1